MKIVVLAGGLSPERNVSLSSGAKVCQALRDLDRALQQGWDAALARLPIPFPRVGAIRGEKPPAALRAQGAELYRTDYHGGITFTAPDGEGS